MFERLVARVETKARTLSESARNNVAEALAEYPDVRLRIEGDTLVIEAEGIMRRWVSDTRLRFAFWRNG